METKLMIIGIAGGSGSGKSTLAYNVHNKFPEKVSIIHLDDYNKKREETPVLYGMVNRDHPDAINFDKLLANLDLLSKGESLKMMVKNERDNPNYTKTGERVEVEIIPKPIILVEGYLVLHDPRIREYFNHSVFLDVSHEVRAIRRTKTNNDDFYTENILLPMHEQYVEPTKQYATHIIDVSNLTPEEVLEEFIKPLKDQFFS